VNPEMVSFYVSKYTGMDATARYLHEAQLHSDMFAATKAAMQYFNPLANIAGLSFGGVVYRIDGQYASTGSLICSRVASLNYSPAITRDNIAAFWRTSGQLDSVHRYFSAVETNLAKKFDCPFYLTNYTGVLKVFHPDDNTLSVEVAEKLLSHAHPGFAIGKLVNDKFDRIVKIGTRLNVHHFSHLKELAVAANG